MQMHEVIFKLCIKVENMIGLNLMTPTCVEGLIPTRRLGMEESS